VHRPEASVGGWREGGGAHDLLLTTYYLLLTTYYLLLTTYYLLLTTYYLLSCLLTKVLDSLCTRDGKLVITPNPGPNPSPSPSPNPNPNPNQASL
jgi:hypothetical protein